MCRLSRVAFATLEKAVVLGEFVRFHPRLHIGLPLVPPMVPTDRIAARVLRCVYVGTILQTLYFGFKIPKL